MRIDIANLPSLSEAEIKRALARPDSFAYFGDNDRMFQTWAMGPVIQHRDSDYLDQSNAHALQAALTAVPEFADQWYVSSASHWAVGWVEHLCYCVTDDNGAPTRIARYLKAWFEYLRDQYPVADDDDFSRREWEGACDAWDNMSVRERIGLCARYDESIFAARRDTFPSDNDAIYEYLRSP